MDRDAQISQLNDIYQLMADGRKGYVEAATKAKDARLGDLLRRLGTLREAMENELADEIRRFKPDDHTQEGTFKGVLHRAWLDIRAALGKGDDRAVLDECVRGEKYLMERLDTVIADSGIAPSSKVILLKDRGLVMEGLTLVEQLRSEFAGQAQD